VNSNEYIWTFRHFSAIIRYRIWIYCLLYNYGDDEMKTNLKLSKQRHQVKSRWYYIFWGSATLSVFIGQMYVGTGYRQMSKSFNRLLDEPITIIEEKFELESPMIVPDSYRSLY
tara:strand:+ start:1981 stop:2322 length:342 start_codon:yes stop_codon:yes gene_type:complete